MRCFPYSEPPDGEAPVLPSLPGNLPAELNRFVGRRAELAAVERRLTEARLVTVTGAGGVGKSRCALRVAARQQERFLDGAWLVELAALRDPALLEHTVSEALGLADQAGPGGFLLADHLADRRLLLVLDGFEHLVEETASLVYGLLRRSPGLRVLAAGRCPLQVPGEWVLPLSGLPAPEPGAPRDVRAGAGGPTEPTGGASPLGAAEPASPSEATAPAETTEFPDPTEATGQPRATDQPASPEPPQPSSCPRPVEDERSEAVCEAAVLFVERAAAVLPGFTLTEDNQHAVAALCHRLDGNPLALELAAGRLRSLSLDQVLHRLDDRFALLVGGVRGVPSHQRTLRNAIGRSHELCAPRERLLWARLSVFAAHFDLEAAEYVCAGSGLPAREVAWAVDALVAQSVVAREDTPVGVRYRMPQSHREYGAGWLDALDDTVRMRRRHRDWYTGLATWCELDWFSPRQTEVALRISQELPNLRLALECALSGGEDARLGTYLASALGFYWTAHGHLAEGRHWLERALEQGSERQEAHLKALWTAGHLAVLQGDTTRARELLQECRDRAERTGNTVALAYCLHRTGLLALFSGDLPTAEDLLRTAAARYTEVGELNSTVLAGQVELAAVLASRDDLTGAEALCVQAQEVCVDHGELWVRSRALTVRAQVAWARGETAVARKRSAEALALAHDLGDRVGTVLAIEALALAVVTEGDPAEGAVLLGAAGRLWEAAALPSPRAAFLQRPRTAGGRRARRLLGRRLYAAYQREGARLGLPAVIARALRATDAGPPHRSAAPQSSGGEAPAVWPWPPPTSPSPSAGGRGESAR